MLMLLILTNNKSPILKILNFRTLKKFITFKGPKISPLLWMVLLQKQKDNWIKKNTKNSLSTNNNPSLSSDCSNHQTKRRWNAKLNPIQFEHEFERWKKSSFSALVEINLET